MANGKADDGTGSSVAGIFQTPFNNTVTGSKPIQSDGMPKVFDYGNATAGFADPGKVNFNGGGMLSGPAESGLGEDIRK